MNIGVKWVNRRSSSFNVHNPETVQLPASSASRVQIPASRSQRPDSSIQSPTSRFQGPESRVQRPESSVQSPASRVQRPASRVQRPESSVQSPDSNVQSPAPRAQRPESSVKLLRPESRNSGMPSFSTYENFPQKLTFLTSLIYARMCAYQGV